MNIHRFARRLSPFLTAYLLLVSLGLPLHKIYCACRGESEISLLAASHDCGHDALFPESGSGTHEVAKLPECSSAQKTCCSATELDDHDCGSDETIVAKFTAEYLIGQDKYFLAEITALPVFAVFNPEFAARPSVPRATPIRGPTPPPLPSGRAWLVAHQTFLC